MKAYTTVSRKTVGEDRVAICPNFGCEYMTRVKPLKFRFLGFGKHPKCKKHHIPLVYVDERIVDFVDAAIACLFDKAGLPPSELLEGVKSKFPDEVTSFVEGWVYCITAGRGVSIISRYMDTISNAYLKQLTKKQIKAFKKGDDSKPNLVNKTIKDGMDEIAIQYARVLKHLRVHSEILIDHQTLKSLSKNLRNYVKDYQKTILKHNEIINSIENEREMSLKEIKSNYDQILNIGTCRYLLGLNLESKEIKKAKITSFDGFSAYHEFYKEGVTVKFTKSNILNLLKSIDKESELSNDNKEYINSDINKKKLENDIINIRSRSRVAEFLNNNEKEFVMINNQAFSSEEQKDMETNQIKINLQKYIDPLIKNYSVRIKNFRKKQLRFGLGYIPKNSPRLKIAYNNRGKCDWIGIIYKITEVLMENNKKSYGRILYGYTTDTLDNRWEWYKSKATNETLENQKIHNAILKIQNMGRNPDDFFIREVIEVHFDDILMRKRERYWIAKDKTQDPKKGFNTDKGGGGGSQIRVNIKTLVKYLALGHGPSYIARIISHNKGYIISKNTISRRINEYWGGYVKAQILFLKPVLECLIIDGFRSNEIINAFGKKGRNIMEVKIPLFFNGMSFLEIRRNYLKKKLSKKLPFVSIEEKIFSQFRNFGRKEIINLINKKWGGFHKAQRKLRQPIVIKLLRADWGGPAIFTALGYTDSYAYNHHNELMQNLFGLNTELARCFFNDFFTISPNEFTHTINPWKEICLQTKSLIEKNKDCHYSGSSLIRDLNGLGYAPNTYKKQSGRILKKIFGMNLIELKNFILYNGLSPELERKRPIFIEYYDISK
ncbi:MAG: hypothetical protein ACTSP9_03405 [Promethearchaeota archaeon]